MPFDESRWEGLSGEYRVPYDPRLAIEKLSTDPQAAWDELWQELYHQGDVGVASYAALIRYVPKLTALDPSDWNGFALASAIEEGRHATGNPDLPDWLSQDYSAAWETLQSLALKRFPGAQDPSLVDSLLGVLAFSKGRKHLGQLASFTDDELAEMLGE